MKLQILQFASLICALTLLSGCKDVPGKPTDMMVSVRPDQVMDFKSLYKHNCAACHGVEGRNGAAIALNNPVYLATAGATNIERITTVGVAGTMMPHFGKSAGGMLTADQIAALTKGMIAAWGTPLSTQPPPYISVAKGDPARGQQVFATYCVSCHGVDGGGNVKLKTGSIVDPAYLALISDQGLRSLIIASPSGDSGRQAMPDWRSDLPGHPLTDQEIADTVAWLAAHRIATPGQPYQPHP